MTDAASITHSMTLQAPYVGLRPYNNDDRRIFYGRERNARILTDKVFSARLTLLYGKSGLGKSSLLHAMVIPELEVNSTTVLYFDEWSAEAPAVALHTAVAEAAVKHGIANATAGAPTLTELVRLLCHSTHTTVVLILDQFEEFLVWHGDHLEPVKDELAALLRANLDVRVMLSMREEYLAALEPFRHDIQNLFQSTYRLEPLDEMGVRTAIMRPLEHFNGSCEPELVDRLIDDLKVRDVNEKEGVAMSGSANGVELPMLQLVCSQLWASAKRAGSTKLSVALYLSRGGDKGILKEYVKSVVPKGPFRQRITADLLRCLAPPSGLKMSFSVDDLANLSELHLKESTITKELRRLESSRILRARKFHTGERFELLHDAFINILTPWITAVRERAARYKRWALWSFTLLILTLAVGAVDQKKHADYWETYAKSTAQRLFESTASLNDSLDHATRVGKLIDEYEFGTNPQKTLLAIKQETERFKQDAEYAAKQTQDVVEKEARSLGKPTMPPAFAMEFNGSVVTLSGTMPDQALIAQAVKTARSTFGEDVKVQNDLEMADTIANPDWLSDVITFGQKLKNILPPASVEADRGVLTITGTALNDAIRTEFGDQAQNAVTPGWHVDNQLMIPPVFMMDVNGFSVTLSGTMPDQASIDRAVTTAGSTFGKGNVQNDLSVGNAITHPDWLSGAIAFGSKLKDIGSPASMNIADRELTIIGSVLNEKIRTAFGDEAQAAVARGLRVNNQLFIPPTFVMEVNGSSVTLSGTMPDRASIDRAVNAAGSTFGQGNVENDLSVGNAITHPDWLSSVIAFVLKLKDIDPPASMKIADRELTITGTVLNEKVRTTFGDKAQAAVTPDWHVNNQLMILPIFAMKVNESSVTLSGTMPDQASIDRAVTTARSSFGQGKVQNNLSVGDTIAHPDWLNSVIAFGPKLKDIDSPASMKIADRELTITGAVLNEKVRTALGNEAQAAVTPDWHVDNQLMIPPTFVMQVHESDVTLSGMMPDQVSVDRAVATARSSFGKDKVKSDLSIGDAITHPDWLNGAIAFAPKLKDIDPPASMKVANRELTVTGTVLNEKVRAKFGKEAQAAVARGLRVNNQLMMPPSFVMKVNGSSVTLSGTMPDQASIDRAVTTVRSNFGMGKVQNDLSVGNAITYPDWLNGVIAFGPKLKDIAPPASMKIADRELTVTGSVLNEKIRTAFGDEAQAAVARGVRINNQLAVPPITFSHDSDVITDAGKAILEKVYKVLLAKYDVIEIAGHTDSTGKAHHNCDLSLQRAESVKSYLIGLGLAEEKFTTKGYSDTIPVDCNSNGKGRIPKNRRVEFHIDGEHANATCSSDRAATSPDRPSACR